MFKKAITLIFVSLLLQACGAAHVRDVTSSEDIDNYTAAFRVGRPGADPATRCRS